MQKTITELKTEKSKLLDDLDAYIQSDDLESDEAKEILKRLACVDDEIRRIADDKKKAEVVAVKRSKLKNWLNIILAVLLVLFIVLTVLLNTSDVFKGKYDTSENGYQFSFYDNTYDFEDGSGYIEQGFFKRSGNEIAITSSSGRTYWLERVSVFKLKDSRGLTFECGGAIVLQTFYAVCMVVCAIVLAVQVRRLRKANK